ncbi:MAG: outer membrane beta-barrel protein, partial [Candidatus Acidiferrales bacterium]
MLKFRTVRAAQLTLCAALAAVWCMPCFAQDASSTASPGQGTGASDPQAAILKELDAMKKRIAELEAELKKENLQEQQSKSTSTPPAKTYSHATASAAPPSAQDGDPSAVTAGAAQTTNRDAVSVPASDSAPAATGTSESSPVTSTAQESTPASPAATQKPAKIAPFSDHDWTWLNGNPRTETPAFDSKFFTPEIRADTTYTYDFNHPSDHSMGGSSEIFRSQEVQLEQLGVGGDFHYDDVHARLMTQFGMYSVTTPRNDASPGNGQWDLADAYRYISEAYGGYHWDALHGVNIDAGIFMSYIGLFSYYNFDNWAYQPSYVSSNTPWFFNGVRIQIFPTAHLKIEPWFINGWQAYGSANHTP